MGRGFHKPGNVENRLGYYLGQIARSAAAGQTLGSSKKQRDFGECALRFH